MLERSGFMTLRSLISRRHYYISIQNPTEKFDNAWISLFKLTKNHNDTFFFVVNVATSVGEATAILMTVG